MRYLTVFLGFSSLFLISNCFAQTKNHSSNTEGSSVIKRISSYAPTSKTDQVVNKIENSTSISNETDDVEYEYEYEFQVPQNQLSIIQNKTQIETVSGTEYEYEYEYEVVNNQVSSISSNAYQEFEYEYETPINQSNTIYNDPNVEYDYE